MAHLARAEHNIIPSPFAYFAVTGYLDRMLCKFLSDRFVADDFDFSFALRRRRSHRWCYLPSAATDG